jgi:predicted metalloendopeptidase
MIKYLKKSFEELVEKDTWFDNSSKNKVLEKLKAIIENVVYPDWILDNNELDKLYKLVNDFHIFSKLLNFIFIPYISIEKKSRS